jgi:hypothetical protein
MNHNPVDVASRVSSKLSALIEARVGDPDADQPVTLASVRMFLLSLLSKETKEVERLHRFDIGDSMLDELDELIEEFGGDTLAVHFAQHEASEALSTVIEAVMCDDTRDNMPTLDTIREAIATGLATELVGEGLIEEDEEAGLPAEIDGLIERFGADTLAEGFLRFE